MRPFSRALVWIALLGLGLGCAGWAAAQSFSRHLEEVRVSATAGREVILLTFSSPYEGNPVEEHQAGAFRLRLSATGSKISRSLFQIREATSLIQDYRVVQSQYATTVVANLRDPQLNLEGQLSFARSGNALQVALNRPAAARATADDEILAQAQRRIGGGEAGTGPADEGRLGVPEQPLGGVEDDWLRTLVTMVLALIFVLLVLYGLVFVYKRFLAGRIGPSAGGVPIRHLGSFAIGPRQRIVVLDINGEVVACGVTPHQISYLTHLGAKPGRSAGGGPPKPADPPQPGTPAPPAGAPPPAGASRSGDPVHQFAESLREKVRSLKRIK